MLSRVPGRGCALALLLMLSAASARAQFDTGSIVGTVRDMTGAVIPGATVTLTSSATGLSIAKTTDGDGNYEFFTVRPGIYLVTSEKAGFALALAENVQVQVAARLRIDLQMALGQVSERVEVVAASPLLETETSQRAQVISELGTGLDLFLDTAVIDDRGAEQARRALTEALAALDARAKPAVPPG